jgi:hypothetical protein
LGRIRGGRRVVGLGSGGVREQRQDGRANRPELERGHAYLPFITNKFYQEANAKKDRPTHA